MPDEIIRREFPAELVPSGDGRTLELRIVPYRTVARVSDDGGRTTYEESWEPGAFDKQLSAANRVDVLANFEHQQGISGVVARGTELRDTGQALDGTFRMLSTQDADKALELVKEGVVTGVSLEAIPLRSERGADGIVRRVKARLVNVALCRMPAFKDAQIMAVREQPTYNVTIGGNPSSSATVPFVAGFSNKESEPEPEEPTPAPDEPDSQRMSPQAVREELAAEEAEKNPPEFSDAELALQRVGFEALLVRAVTAKAWDGSPARFTDEEYQRSCLIDRGGDMPMKERCSLPVLEPDGTINSNALGAAAAALAGARGGLRMVSPEMKATAARKLVRYYREAKMDPPSSLTALAGR